MTSGEHMHRLYKQLTGPVHRTKTGGPPQQLFFLFHGWGADGSNLLDIALSLSHDFPEAEFHLPNAPYICEVNTDGYQWFSLSDESTNALLNEIEAVSDIVEHYIRDRIKCANLSHTQVVLFGFSQGAMLAKHLALTRKDLCAVVAAYSGKLIDVPKNRVDQNIPMILIHGDEDLVIPVEAMVDSYEILKNLSVPVDAYRMIDLGHGINQAGLELGHRFIKQHLGLGE